MINNSIIQPEIQHLSEEIEVIQFEIPRWLFTDLCKIQAAQGIPLETLLKSQLEDLVMDNWDLEKDQPQMGVWNG